MSHEITILSAETEAQSTLLIATILATLTHCQQDEAASVTLRLTNDVEIAQLNAQFRAENRPTDVLSFPYGEPLEPNGPLHLGDIAIALPQARQQAEKGGHSLEAELQLLAVHGTLHLLGYDHTTPDEQAEMWAEQSAVLAQLGSAITSPALVNLEAHE